MHRTILPLLVLAACTTPPDPRLGLWTGEFTPATDGPRQPVRLRITSLTAGQAGAHLHTNDARCAYDGAIAPTDASGFAMTATLTPTSAPTCRPSVDWTCALPPGGTQLECNAPGWGRLAFPEHDAADAQPAYSAGQVALNGRVVRVDGSGVAGAQITWGDADRAETSGGNGGFILSDLGIGTSTFRVTAPGHLPAEFRAYLAEPGQFPVGDVTLWPEAALADGLTRVSRAGPAALAEGVTQCRPVSSGLFGLESTVACVCDGPKNEVGGSDRYLDTASIEWGLYAHEASAPFATATVLGGQVTGVNGRRQLTAAGALVADRTRTWMPLGAADAPADAFVFAELIEVHAFGGRLAAPRSGGRCVNLTPASKAEPTGH